jgi:hypothetical protein
MGRPRSVRRYLGDTLVVAALGAIALLLLGAGCEDRVVSPGTGGDLSVTEGAEVMLATGDRIHFDQVAADSRCPLGLMCVWEGEAKAAFSLRSGHVDSPFSLGITGSLAAADTVLSMQRFQTAVVGRYHFTLLQLDPYPSAGKDPLKVRSTALIRVEY